MIAIVALPPPDRHQPAHAPRRKQSRAVTGGAVVRVCRSERADVTTRDMNVSVRVRRPLLRGSRTEQRGEYRCHDGRKRGSFGVLRITGGGLHTECRASSKALSLLDGVLWWHECSLRRCSSRQRCVDALGAHGGEVCIMATISHRPGRPEAGFDCAQGRATTPQLAGAPPPAATPSWGNSAPPALFAFAVTTFMLSLVNADAFANGAEPAVFGVALMFGGSHAAEYGPHPAPNRPHPLRVSCSPDSAVSGRRCSRSSSGSGWTCRPQRSGMHRPVPCANGGELNTGVTGGESILKGGLDARL